MSVFDDFWKALASAIGGLAVGALKDYKDSVVADGLAFANSMKSDLQKWTAQLTTGDMTPGDVEFLLKGKRDLATLIALKEKGLAKVALDKFYSDLIQVIAGTAGKFFPLAK